MVLFGYVTSPNTLLYYSFNDQNLNDGSEYGRNGTWYNGSGTYVQGIKGYGVNLSGQHAIKLPIPCPSGNFTYSICVKLDSYNSYNSLLGVEQRTTGCIHFHITNDASLRGIILGINSGITTNIPSGVNALPSLNAWHNIIVTRNGNVWTIYLDGIQYAQGTSSFTPNQSFQWYIGKEYTDNRYINGTIDEVIFEDKVRTQEEITKYVHKLGLI